MKRNLLSIVAIALVSVLAFASCNKDKQMSDYLTNKNGWKMTSVKCTHELHLQNNTTIAANTELLDGDYANGTGYFYAYEIDDIYKFVADEKTPTEGAEYLNCNKNLGEGAQTAEDKKLGDYVINNDTKILGLYLPWAPTAFTSASIKTLDAKTMELICNYTVQADNAKLDAGDYTFTVKFAAE
ncbi:MAG: hypothetical protein IJP65_01155 [Bacteroidales bacterium]|nr:hypothetical protein [Bacteroidales bacterium]